MRDTLLSCIPLSNSGRGSPGQPLLAFLRASQIHPPKGKFLKEGSNYGRSDTFWLVAQKWPLFPPESSQPVLFRQRRQSFSLTTMLLRRLDGYSPGSESTARHSPNSAAKGKVPFSPQHATQQTKRSSVWSEWKPGR